MSESVTPDPILHVRDLQRRFGGIVAVAGVSFDIYPNEIVGLIGPNGAGKSTIFNLISGFYRPHAGRLTFRGKDITGRSPDYISRNGLVRTFQHDSLLRDMTVYENLLIATLGTARDGIERDRRVRETATLLGLDGVLDELARNLPHGRQRILGIAIAAAARPALLCLDESLTGLNLTEAQDALKIVRRLRDDEGMTILFVEHNMRAVMQLCDRVIVLHHGELLATGEPQAISRDPKVIEAYLGEQR